MIQHAPQTLAMIEENIERDQGASFRNFLAKVLPHIHDAYAGEDEGFRTHLGASLIGEECDRKIWYGFRWVRKAAFSSQALRIFNRGHLEEGRFLSLLLACGIQVFQQGADGKQFRISDVGGHFGGSCDGVALGIPDVEKGLHALLEFKTHNTKSFSRLVAYGVKESKFTHYVQMQVYMRKMGLPVALYMAVNKDTDELYAELVQVDHISADLQINKARTIILKNEAPTRLRDSPGWTECKYCDYRDICHLKEPAAKNCRSCTYAVTADDGTWRCIAYNVVLNKEQQLTGCTNWEQNSSINN